MKFEIYMQIFKKPEVLQITKCEPFWEPHFVTKSILEELFNLEGFKSYFYIYIFLYQLGFNN